MDYLNQNILDLTRYQCIYFLLFILPISIYFRFQSIKLKIIFYKINIFNLVLMIIKKNYLNSNLYYQYLEECTKYHFFHHKNINQQNFLCLVSNYN